MKVYVATQYAAKDVARAMFDYLTERGHEITHDWTTVADKGDYETYATDDANGVADADVLVVIPRPRCRGTWVEMGIAIAMQKQVVVVSQNKPGHWCIFEHMPGVHHAANAEELIAVLAHLEGFHDSYRN